MKKFLQVLGVVTLALLVLIAVGMGYLYMRQNGRFLVSSTNMMPTLHKKDLLEVDQGAFHNRPPDKGEVVVFRSVDDQKFILVGRVVGVPGDEVSFFKRRLQVNGSGVSQSSQKIKVELEGSPLEVEEAIESLGPSTYKVWYILSAPDMEYRSVKVPPDQYYIVGDNRDNSADSRFTGPVPRANLIGSVKTVIEAVDPSRAGKGVNP